MLPRGVRYLLVIAIGLVAAMTAFVLGVYVAQAPQRYRSLPESEDRAAPVTASARLTFVGDIMFAREVERALIANGVDWPFAEIKDEWAESDLVIGNYEATIRDTYRYEGAVLAFDVLPELNTGLANVGFTHLSLANNHGDDFGDAVAQYTREVIAGLGIQPFGDPAASELFVARTEPNGIPVSLIGFHAFSEYPSSLVDAITQEDAAGRFVIVYPHWGNEYQFEPSSAQREAATMFIDAGADLIIGAHPHVIEPIELVDGVPVAWSLGNFIFDQDWSQETMEGLMLHVALTDDAVTIEAVPVDVKNRQAAVMTGDHVAEILTAIGVPNGTITYPRATQTP